MGLQSVLNLGKNSLAQNQVALQTIAHNIANAGVEGYSRQEAIAVNTPPTQHAFGSGKSADCVARLLIGYHHDLVCQARIKNRWDEISLSNAFYLFRSCWFAPIN